MTSTISLPASLSLQKVEYVRHWTDTLFELRVSRPASFRFRSGEFVMIGLIVDSKPLLRAYSIASPAWDEALDFYSIKVADGPLTSRLQHVKVGSEILLGRKPTGTLVLDALVPGRRLYLFSTGTGFAPFASLLREPETYEKFQEVIITHTCRHIADLSYGKHVIEGLREDPLVGELVSGRVAYYPTTTRERYDRMGRITDLMASGDMFNDLDLPPIEPSTDRAMICGSMDMINDTKSILGGFGLKEGSNASPGDFVIEKAFAG